MKSTQLWEQGQPVEAQWMPRTYLSLISALEKLKLSAQPLTKSIENLLRKMRHLEEGFQKVDLDEPSREESIKILHGVARKLQEYHKVKISKRMVEAAVDLSIKYISDRHLPDKAIDVLDESCAAKVLHKSKEMKWNPMGLSEFMT